ncbi:centaurin/arf-related [Schistosoma mansoni]|uniref:centaurin/arf-related n=1 Tax=Schistosoma mansoni TaxID=6183 RepID=UPI00022DC2B6|nr:centaurin/arf-related [Schistosoma mansoni]|eukprot:XP_018651345.1 centaurin/arf-related [Schistosoma mansoni]
MSAQADLCADCSTPSPKWASVNRGVLLCDECSSIHRQLGRHISQVKHLEKSRWRPSQLSMVRYLASAGANGYWEHVFKAFHPHKKPLPTDPVHPTKADFIREKYLFLGFFKRPRNVNHDDLNQQLHASVRTGVLETSLYLLALGANPNFLHPIKGTAPIHVACQYGQIGQVELLLAYGADVCIRNSSGKTVIDIALDKALALNESISSKEKIVSMSSEERLQSAWSSMVDVLVSAYYDLTDSLAYFLTRHVPDHKAAVFGGTHKNINHSNELSVNNNNNSEIITNGHFLISTSLIHESNGTSLAPKSTDVKLTNSTGQTITTTATSNVEQADDQEDWIIKARGRLNNLPNNAFIDLCIDVYDEADRRLTNSFLENLDTFNNPKHLNNYSIFNGSNASNNDNNNTSTKNELHASIVKETRPTIQSGPNPSLHKTTTLRQTSAITNLTLFFLPPNTTYSSVRNQARQKLGRLSTIEFHTLTLDVLTEASIRLLPLFLPLTKVINPTTTAVTAPATTTVEVSSKKSRKAQHSYTDYFNTDKRQQLNEFIISRRNGPLPSLPSPKTKDNHIDDVERLHSTNNSDGSSSPCGNLDKQLINECNDILQETLISENLPDHEHLRLELSSSPPPPVNVKSEILLKKFGRSRDDPVYDQVAGEGDLNENTLSNIQTVTSDHNILSMDIEESSLNNQQNMTESSLFNHSNASLTAPLSPSAGRESDHHTQQTSDGNDESDSIGPIPPITSRPGPLPGSRRLHLSHTSRIAQHRASVPTPSTITTNSDVTGCGSNPLSLSESTSSVIKSSDSPKNLTQHSLINSFNAENSNDIQDRSLQSHTHHHRHPESCCVAARNEVERLHKENNELKVQLSDLQNSKDIVEQRLEDLEGRIIQLDSIVQVLKEEKSALLAAFSAGMVMVHNPLKISCDSDSQQPTSDTTTTATSVGVYSSKLKAIKGSETPLTHYQWDYEKDEEDGNRVYGEEITDNGEEHEDDEVGEVGAEQYKDDDSEYDMERVIVAGGSNDKSSNAGNYAMGSHCLDSGVLLRQGIILRGSRGGSPASVTAGVGSGVTHQTGFGHSHPSISQSNIITPSFRGLVKNNNIPSRNNEELKKSFVFTSTSQNISSTPQNIPIYVNTPHVIQHPLSKSKPTLVSGTSITLADALNPDIPDDYTAPNATGSPSPAPIPISQNLANQLCSHVTTISSNMNIPSSHHRHHHHQGKSSRLLNSHLNKPTISDSKKQSHHSEVLVSISKSSPDYDNASRSSSLIHSSNESFYQIGKHSRPGGGSGIAVGVSGDQVWNAPSSERVVRCVETIIMRIRSLVEIANGDRHGNDSAHCSRLIQLAVKDLLSLFTSDESHPMEVKSALNNLATESENLRRDCEQITTSSSFTSPSSSSSIVGSVSHSGRPVPPEITILIRHAHQIARAAKDLLSLFQRSDP